MTPVFSSRSRRARTLPVLLGGLLALGACSTPSPQADELPPIHPVGRASSDLPPGPPLPTPRARVFVQQFILPLDLPTDAAWQVIDEDAFPRVTRSVWNANGLRVGLVLRDDLPDVIDALPARFGDQLRQLIASEHPVPLRRSPPLRSTFLVDLTIPPLAVTEDRIDDGRAQLLLSVDADQTLYLTPHHHKIQPRLLPPKPLEKELDGRIYRELTLALDLRRQTILVVGLHRPWPLLATDDQPDAPPQPRPDHSLARYDLTRPPGLPNDLGRALFTGVVGGQPVQLFLLITLEPLPATPATFAR